MKCKVEKENKRTKEKEEVKKERWKERQPKRK